MQMLDVLNMFSMRIYRSREENMKLQISNLDFWNIERERETESEREI